MWRQNERYREMEISREREGGWGGNRSKRERDS